LNPARILAVTHTPGSASTTARTVRSKRSGSRSMPEPEQSAIAPLAGQPKFKSIKGAPACTAR
jgi:hypothetical protein